MHDIIVYAVAIFFLLMGIVALIKPENITSYLAMPVIPADMKNEVRAAYGGFGVAIAGILVAATRMEASRDGILLTVAVAVLGMAFGRLVSLGIERAPGKYPYIFLCGELLMGGGLLFVWYSEFA